MADIDIRMDLLNQLVDDLGAIITEFENADGFSDEVAAAVGHDELSGKVRDFAHAWNDKRAKMTEAVTTLRTQIEAIADNFTDVDSELARALEEAAAEVSQTSPEAMPV